MQFSTEVFQFSWIRFIFLDIEIRGYISIQYFYYIAFYNNLVHGESEMRAKIFDSRDPGRELSQEGRIQNTLLKSNTFC